MKTHVIRYDFSKSLEDNAIAIASWYDANPTVTIHFVVKYEDGLMIHYKD